MNSNHWTQQVTHTLSVEAVAGDDPFLVIVRRGNRFWIDLREVHTLIEVLQHVAANLNGVLPVEATSGIGEAHIGHHRPGSIGD